MIHKNTQALIDDIKSEIKLIVDDYHKSPKIKLSEHLAKKLNYHYIYMSNVFTEHEKQSIQQYFIKLKIEKVKEMFQTKRLTECAYKLHYSSVGHLSNQFKRITGMTPSEYKFNSGNTTITINNNNLIPETI